MSKNRFILLFVTVVMISLSCSSASLKGTKPVRKKIYPHHPLRGRIIALNAGHNPALTKESLKNGDGVGAYSSIGINKMFYTNNPIAIQSGPHKGVIRESDLTQSVVLLVKKDLEKLGASVVLTRIGPCADSAAARLVNLKNRAAKANKAGADLLLDIHGNCGYKTFSGYMLLIPCPERKGAFFRYRRLHKATGSCVTNRRFNKSLYFARLIHRQLLLLRGNNQRAIPPYRNPPFYVSTFKVIGYSLMPATLLELGFMSHRKDMDLLAGMNYRKRVAGALVKAIVQFLNRDNGKQL